IAAARSASAPMPAGPTPAEPAKRRPWISIQFKRAASTGQSTAAPTAPAARAADPSAPSPAIAPSPGRESAASRKLHQRLFWLAILLDYALWFYPLTLRWLPDNPFISPAGLGLQILFALLYIWARRHLGRHWSGAIQIKSGHQLIRTGPYRLLRHP